MKTAFFLLFITFCVAKCSYCQVEYSVIKDDPHDVPNLDILILPVVLAYDVTNFSFGGQAGVIYKISKMQFEGTYRMAYVDNKMFDDYEFGRGIPANGKNNLRKWEILGAYIISEKTGEESTHVTVRSTSSTDYMIKIPAKWTSSWGVRAGVNSLSTLVNDMGFGGFMVDTPSISLEEHLMWDVAQSEYQTMMNATTVFVGVSRTKIVNLEINTKQFGERSYSKRYGYYADILFSPAISLDNMIVSRRVGNVERSDKFNLEDSQFNPLGVRFGYFATGNDPLNLYYRLEAGLQPGVGPISGQLFCTFSVGMSFGLKT